MHRITYSIIKQLIFCVLLTSLLIALSGCSSRTDRAERDIQALVTAMHDYRIDVGDYPERDQALQALLASPHGASNWKGPYVKKVKDLIDPWGNPYQYAIPGQWGAPFDIFTATPDGSPIRAWQMANAEMQLNMGFDYANGHDVSQDHAEAIYWWHMAAEQGNAQAQSILGSLYEEGRGVIQDDAEAVRWFRLAAEQGDALAQNNLGMMYRRGRGVPQDNDEALWWFSLAAEQGHIPAQRNLRRMGQ